MTDKINARAMARSFTGYDELAIKKAFGSTFEDLEGMFAGRALLFVKYRRAGMKDTEAYKASMECTVGGMEEHFLTEDDADEDAEGNGHGPTHGPTRDS